MDIAHTFFNTEILLETFPFLWRGLWVTLELGVISIVAGLIAGLLLALVRLYGSSAIRYLAGGYINVFRSMPVLVLLIIVYYALPFVQIRMSPFWSATVTLTLVSAAYTAEIFRAGIEAVPKGQFEASDALGLNSFRTMTDVVLPQAIKIVIPPLTSNCINVIKDTALASVVALPDLLKEATQAQAVAANPTPLIGAAAIYLIFLCPLVILVTRLEKKFHGAQNS